MLYLLLLPLGILVGVLVVLNYDKLQRLTNEEAEDEKKKQQKSDRATAIQIADENVLPEDHVDPRHHLHHHRKHSSTCSHRGRRSTSVRNLQHTAKTHTVPQHDEQVVTTKSERHTSNTTSANLPVTNSRPIVSYNHLKAHEDTNLETARTARPPLQTPPQQRPTRHPTPSQRASQDINNQVAPSVSAPMTQPARRRLNTGHIPQNQVQRKGINRAPQHGHPQRVVRATQSPQEHGAQQRVQTLTTPQQGHPVPPSRQSVPPLQQAKQPRLSHASTDTPQQTMQQHSDHAQMPTSHQVYHPQQGEAPTTLRRQIDGSSHRHATNQPQPPPKNLPGGPRDKANSDKSANQQRTEMKRVSKKTVTTSRKATVAPKKLPAGSRDRSSSEDKIANQEKAERNKTAASKKTVPSTSQTSSTGKRMTADHGKAKRFRFLQRRPSDPQTTELTDEQTAITN